MIIDISGVMIKLRPPLAGHKIKIEAEMCIYLLHIKQRVDSNFEFRQQLNKGNYQWSSSAITHKSLLVEFFSKSGLL